MIKSCKVCGFADLKQNVCQLFRMKIDPDSDYCSKLQDKTTVKICDVCGRAIVDNHSTFLVPTENIEWKLLCDECINLINTCAFCKNSQTCDFETNPSTLPKMVQKQIRQGNMVAVTTIKNPERIRETCQKNCKCFSAENGCMREFNYCKELNRFYGNPTPDE